MRKLLACVALTVLVGSLITSSPVNASINDEGPPQPAEASPLSDVEAASVLESCKQLPAQPEEGTARDADSYDFVCLQGELYTQPSPSGSESQSSGPVARADIADVELNCDPFEPPNRHIVSELQAFAQFCVIFGRDDTGTSDDWARSIWVTWTFYSGWNSGESQISTQPSNFENPTLKGTISTRREYGVIVAPVSTSAWTNVGAESTYGWTVGGLTQNGRYSAAVNDLDITLPSKGFHRYLGEEYTTHRFICHSDTERCFWPNAQEAP